MTGVPESRRICSPGELTSLIREIKAAVADGVLEQARTDLSAFAMDVEIATLPERGPWPDFIEMRFQVRGTGNRYTLSVETYHGAGGTWQQE
jgi:hypothetical protein